MHTTFLGETRKANVLGNFKRRDYLRDGCIDEWMIVKPILKKKDPKIWIGFTWFSRTPASLMATSQHGDEYSGVIKVLNSLVNYQLLDEYSTQWI